MNSSAKKANEADLSTGTPETKLQTDGPCQVCGRPGIVQAHPSAPVSVIRCGKHSDTKTFNPIYVVMAVFGITVVGVLIYIAKLIIERFA